MGERMHHAGWLAKEYQPIMATMESRAIRWPLVLWLGQQKGCRVEPPLTRIEHRSEHGCWTLVRRDAAPALRPFVRGYEGYLETGGRPVRRRELPQTRIPLIFNLGAPFELAEAGGWRLLPSFVAGLHERFSLVGSTAGAHCVQVDLTPLGATAVLGLPVGALANRVVDLDDLPGRALADLVPRLHDLAFWEARFALLDAVLTARIAAACAVPPRVAAAWRLLAASEGALTVGRLARDLDCSRQHLSQVMRDALGLPPKRVARLMRFERAVTLLQRGAIRGMAELAAACGYCDQAHLDRDMRGFAGSSPTALLRRMLPDGTGVMAT